MHRDRTCEQRNTAVALLDVVDVPVAILTKTGVPLAMNSSFNRLLLGKVAACRDRLVLCNQASDALFAKCLTSPHSGSRTIPIPAGRGASAALLHVVPFPETLAAVWLDAGLVVTVAVLTTRKCVPEPEALMHMFGLTQAEARIARAIAEGQTTSAIATSLNTSRETVRSQLKSVLAKTCVSRQGELISLLTTTRLVRD